MQNRQAVDVSRALDQIMRTRIVSAGDNVANVALAFARCEALAKTIKANCYDHGHMSATEECLCCLKQLLESEQ